MLLKLNILWEMKNAVKIGYCTGQMIDVSESNHLPIQMLNQLNTNCYLRPTVTECYDFNSLRHKQLLKLTLEQQMLQQQLNETESVKTWNASTNQNHVYKICEHVLPVAI